MIDNISLINMCKAYAGNILFKNASYCFTKQVYHITGRNGVGKSTLLRLIVGLDSVDSGEIRLGQADDQAQTSQAVFYCPDELAVYDFLTGEAYLSWITPYRTSDCSDVKGIVAQFGIEPYLNTRLADMSFGTKKKFVLASVLVGQPDFIVLDEPFNGLDKQAQQTLINILAKKSPQTGLIIVNHMESMMSELHPIKVKIEEGALLS